MPHWLKVVWVPTLYLCLSLSIHENRVQYLITTSEKVTKWNTFAQVHLQHIGRGWDTSFCPLWTLRGTSQVVLSSEGALFLHHSQWCMRVLLRLSLSSQPGCTQTERKEWTDRKKSYITLHELQMCKTCLGTEQCRQTLDRPDDLNKWGGVKDSKQPNLLKHNCLFHRKVMSLK